MTELHIYKAQDTTATEPVPTMTIVIGDVPMPSYNTLDEQQLAFTHEGENLERALLNSLPQGTYHALLVAMLQRKHSLLVIVDKKNGDRTK